MGLLGSLGKGLAKTLLDVDMGPLRITGGTVAFGGKCPWCGGEKGSASVRTSDGEIFCCRKCATEYIQSQG